ncbi:MAG: hypothetical protein C4533_03150 [Candidatus Omnitrophota bacterium]|jgi:hypothetical protein|nr:MAG: hypothetical protein C4533_03150 [Candidatus Omnitrophota bacterium]
MSIIYDALKKLEGRRVRPKKDPLADISADKLTANQTENKEQKKKNFKLKSAAIYIFVVIFGFISAKLIFNYFPSFWNNYGRSKPKERIELINVTATDAAKPAQQILPKDTAPSTIAGQQKRYEKAPELELNGIFYSEDESYALVNNQIVKAGDNIDGVDIVEINENNVKVRFGDRDLILDNTKTK